MTPCYPAHRATASVVLLRTPPDVRDLLDLQEADAGGGEQKVEHGDPSILDPSLVEQVKGKGKGKEKEKVVNDEISADTMFER